MSPNSAVARPLAPPRCSPISEKPRMACSGVRSSWLTLAMNSVFAAEAFSAASRASRVVRSASRRSLTSRNTLTMPAGAPSPPGISAIVIRMSRSRPSARRACAS